MAVITSFAVLNSLGIKNSAKTLRAIVGVNVGILIIFTVVGFLFFHPSHLDNFFANGPYGIISGAAIIFFAFSGFSRVTTVSEEVVNPEKTIPLAIITSILISAALYFLISLSTIGLATTSELSGSTSPLTLAASETRLTIIVLAVSVGALVATSGVILTGIRGTSRVMFAMARDGHLPRQISVLDRFSTPVVAIVISLMLAVSMMPAASFGTIVESSNTCVIAAYAIINAAALKVHLGYKSTGSKGLLGKDWFFLIPFSGIVTIGVFFVFLGLESIEIAASVILLASLIYFANGKKGSRSLKSAVPRISSVRLFGKSREIRKASDEK